MPTEEIIQFIKASLASGDDAANIRNELRSRGFANDDIDAAFVTAQAGEDDSVDVNNKPSLRLSRSEIFIILACILILGVAAGVAVAYFK